MDLRAVGLLMPRVWLRWLPDRLPTQAPEAQVVRVSLLRFKTRPPSAQIQTTLDSASPRTNNFIELTHKIYTFITKTASKTTPN